MKKVQRILNNTEQYVVNGGQRWKTTQLMESCNWLGASELMEFHSLVTLWKLKMFKKPPQIASKFNWDIDDEVTTDIPRLQTTSEYIRWRTTKLWTEMDNELKHVKKISSFKIKLRKWIIGKRLSQNGGNDGD